MRLVLTMRIVSDCIRFWMKKNKNIKFIIMMIMNKEIALRINKSFSESWIKGMRSLRICIPLEDSCKKSKERRDKGNRKNNQHQSGVLYIQPARGPTRLTCPTPFRSQFHNQSKNVFQIKRAVLIGKLSFSNLQIKARW
jgi:hypothetical protein